MSGRRWSAAQPIPTVPVNHWNEWITMRDKLAELERPPGAIYALCVLFRDDWYGPILYGRAPWNPGRQYASFGEWSRLELSALDVRFQRANLGAHESGSALRRIVRNRQMHHTDAIDGFMLAAWNPGVIVGTDWTLVEAAAR